MVHRVGPCLSLSKHIPAELSISRLHWSRRALHHVLACSLIACSCLPRRPYSKCADDNVERGNVEGVNTNLLYSIDDLETSVCGVETTVHRHHADLGRVQMLGLFVWGAFVDAIVPKRRGDTGERHDCK